MPEHPIFIVGVPRSGTTVLAAILNAHSKLACSVETHFFSKTTKKQRDEAVSDPQWPTKAVELVASLRLGGQQVHRLFGFTLEQINTYLSAEPPSASAMLESLTKQFQLKAEKTQWVEKTPNHLLHLSEIRDLYHEAKIIRIIRDPRDSSLSMCQFPWSSSSAVANAYLWEEWYQKSKSFFEYDDRSYTLRYEDLVEDPAQEVKDICDFIGLPFEEGMIDTKESSSDLISEGEPWKKRVAQPIDSSRKYRWRRTMARETSLSINLICSEAISLFEYEREGRVHKEVFVYGLEKKYVEDQEGWINQMASCGVSIRKTSSITQLIKQINLGYECVITEIKDSPTSLSNMAEDFKLMVALAHRFLRRNPVLSDMKWINWKCRGGKRLRLKKVGLRFCTADVRAEANWMQR